MERTDVSKTEVLKMTETDRAVDVLRVNDMPRVELADWRAERVRTGERVTVGELELTMTPSAEDTAADSLHSVVTVNSSTTVVVTPYPGWPYSVSC